MQSLITLKNWILSFFSDFSLSWESLSKYFFIICGFLIALSLVKYILSLFGKIKALLFFGGLLLFYLHSVGVISFNPSDIKNSIENAKTEGIKNTLENLKSRLGAD